MEESKKVPHPFDQLTALGDDIRRAIFDRLTRGRAAVVQSRARTLRHYLDRAQQLDRREKELHRSMCPRVRKVMEGKRILLMQEMLQDIGCPDDRLAQDLVAGVPHSG